MQLSYRGVSYNKNSAGFEMLEGEMGGKYRGNDWKYHYPRHIPQLSPKNYQQYRGIVYGTPPSMPKIDSSYREKSNSMAEICSVPLRKSQKIALDEISQTHLENIRRNLERRLAAAQARGDSELITLLELESQQLALNL